MALAAPSPKECLAIVQGRLPEFRFEQLTVTGVSYARLAPVRGRAPEAFRARCTVDNRPFPRYNARSLITSRCHWKKEMPMKAKIQTLDSLFNTDISYRIPVFQRPYAWGKVKQWQPLWDDARRIAQKLLGSDDNEAPPPHFMGALVLQLQSAESGEVVKRIVVDGQQRLTTLQLLTKAAHESFQNLDDLTRANRFTKLLQNTQSKWGGDSDNETKVRQSNINDLQSFQDVIRGLGTENRPLRSIGEAYQYFVDEVSEWLNAQPAQRNARAKALERALTEYLQVATVDLDEGEHLTSYSPC